MHCGNLRSRLMTAAAWATVAFLGASASATVSLGQLDDFEDGTVQGWIQGGAGNPTSNIPNGGPTGAGDNYLETVGDGPASDFPAGPGSVPATFNESQWTGAWDADVTAVEVDMANFGSDALSMRLVLFGNGGSRYVSNSSVNLPADGQWHTLVFGVTSSTVSDVVSSGESLTDARSNAVRLMFRHQIPDGAAGGSAADAALGLDNITAVPEPAGLALLALGGLLATRRRR